MAAVPDPAGPAEPATQDTHRVRVWAARLVLTITLALGTAGLASPATAGTRDAGVPTPAPAPRSLARPVAGPAAPAPAPQTVPTTRTPPRSRATATVRPEPAAPAWRPAGETLPAVATAPAHHTAHAQALAADDRDRLARSLIYSGGAALLIAGTGLAVVGARRRLW